MNGREKAPFRKKQNGIYYFILPKPGGGFQKVSTGTRDIEEAFRFKFTFEQNQNGIAPRIITLSAFLKVYIDYLRPLKSEAYLRSVILSFRKLIEFLGDVNISEITKLQIYEFTSNTYQRAEYSASLYFRTLRAGFNWAVKSDSLSASPFNGVKLPRAKKNFPVYASPEELDHLIKHIQNKIIAQVITVLFYTGLRPSEALNLRVNCIDLSRGFITVRNQNGYVSKTRAERIVPISPVISRIISEAVQGKSDNDFLFEKVKGVRINVDYVSKSFKKAVRLSGINPRLKLYSTRHGFASTLAQNNVSPFVLKELLGHTDIKTTLIYSHIQNRNLIDAVSTLSGLKVNDTTSIHRADLKTQNYYNSITTEENKCA